MPVVSSGSLTITDLNDSVLLSLSLPSVSLPADAAGTVSSYSTAVTTARVMQGGVDVTSSWTLSKVDSSCTSTLSSGVVTVSAMSADSAYVDVTASRAGWPTLTARFALSKAKQGATGKDGTNLIDTSTWQPGSTFPAGWSVWQDTPIAGNETQFVQAAGPTGQLTTVLECTADSANKLYTPQSPFSPLSFWFLDGATTTNIAPTVVVDTTNGWTADGSTTYSGNCFKITKASSTTASQGIVSRAVAVTPGETLRIRVRVRADAASTTGLYIRINQATSMPASGSVSASNRASSTDLVANVACTSTYTTYQNLTYVVPAGIVAISLCVFSHYNVSPASAGPLTLYVDDPCINRAAYGDSATGPRQSAEGGWGQSPAVPINPTQTYRFVLPIRNKSTLYHHAYFGPLANQVCLLNTSTLATNPYFWGGDATSLTVDEWYLVVGYVYPAGSTGQTSDSAGVWRISTGQRVIAGTNVCWPAGATSVQTRAAQYYGDNGAKLQIGKPLMHVVDGSEPPLSDLIPVTLNPTTGVITGAGTPTQVSNTFVPIVANAGSSGVGLVWQTPLGTSPNQYWGIEPLIAGDGIEILDSDAVTPGIRINNTRSERLTCVVTDDQGFTTTTLTDVAGLTWPVEAYCAYEVSGTLVYRATGSNTGLTLLANGDDLLLGRYTGEVTAGQQSVRLLPLTSASLSATPPTANANYMCDVNLLYVTAAAGTRKLQAALVNTGPTLTIKRGSHLTVRKIKEVGLPTVTLGATLGISAASTARGADYMGFSPSSSNLTLTLKTDGTWARVHSYSPNELEAPAAPHIGSWGTPTTVGAGAGYECLITTSITSGAATISNSAASWSNLASQRGVSVQVGTPAGGYSEAVVSVAVKVRKIGTTTPELSSTMTWTLSAGIGQA